MLKKRIFGLMFAAIFSPSAFSGAQAIFVDTEDAKANKTIISSEGDFLKFENQGDKYTSVMIYNKNKNEIIVVDHKYKSFNRIDEAFVTKVAQQMQMLKRQMASITPQQRQMMESMMGGSLPVMDEGPSEKSIYKKTQRQQKAAGHHCSVTEKYTQGVKDMEFCVTDQSKVAGSQELFAITKDMMVLLQTLIESIPGAGYEDNPLDEIHALDGFPLAVTEYKNGKVKYRLELESIGKKTFDDNFFKSPEGYKEETTPRLGAR